MTTGSQVDFLKNLLAFLWRHAPLEHSSGDALIELAISDGVGLNAAHNLTCPSLIPKELLPN